MEMKNHKAWRLYLQVLKYSLLPYSEKKGLSVKISISSKDGERFSVLMNRLMYEEEEMRFMVASDGMWQTQPSDLLQGELLVLW